MENLTIHGDGLAAQFIRILASTGCDITDERNRSLGMMAYNTAMLLWRSYESQFKSACSFSRHQEKVGRNDLCPCGSGQKYKKCCLTKESGSHQLTNQTPNIPFGPDLIPRIWDENNAYDDMIAFSDLVRKDPNLKKLRFSASKIETFLKQHRYDPEFFQKMDRETKDQYIDKLSVQFAIETGEGKILERATDLILAAAKNVKTAKELRALASGVVFTATYKNNGYADCPLTPIIFRISVNEILKPISKLRKIADDLESKVALGEIDDTQRMQAAMDLWKGLSKKEKNALEKVASDMFDDISRCLSEGKFPIGLPFATTLPLLRRALQLNNKDGFNADSEELHKIIEECGDNLTDDDYRILLGDLEQWISENEGRQDFVSDSVKMLHMLAKSKSLAPIAPQFLIETCRQNLFIFIDDHEVKMVENWRDLMDENNLIHYASLLQSKGYPQIAERTRNILRHH